MRKQFEILTNPMLNLTVSIQHSIASLQLKSLPNYADNKF